MPAARRTRRRCRRGGRRHGGFEVASGAERPVEFLPQGAVVVLDLGSCYLPLEAPPGVRKCAASAAAVDEQHGPLHDGPRTRTDAGAGSAPVALSPPFSGSRWSSRSWLGSSLGNIVQDNWPYRPSWTTTAVVVAGRRRSAAGRRRRRCACPSSPAARPRRERREDEFREPLPPVRVDGRRTCLSA